MEKELREGIPTKGSFPMLYSNSGMGRLFFLMEKDLNNLGGEYIRHKNTFGVVVCGERRAREIGERYLIFFFQ